MPAATEAFDRGFGSWIPSRPAEVVTDHKHAAGPEQAATLREEEIGGGTMHERLDGVGQVGSAHPGWQVVVIALDTDHAIRNTALADAGLREAGLHRTERDAGHAHRQAFRQIAGAARHPAAKIDDVKRTLAFGEHGLNQLCDPILDVMKRRGAVAGSGTPHRPMDCAGAATLAD